MRMPPRLSLLAAAAALLPAFLAGPAEATAPFGHVRRALGDVCSSDLPPQAHDTLDLIETGGPYPYPQDGSVFRNRERVLPNRSAGYYHEYTVITPGAPTRGPRRVVTGSASREDYYSADHYASFDRVEHHC
ncbi:ribonuclease domain-containing protein [Streptomyces sp. NPDC006368]|uniref:ribonuclease domain-containing protein n=1 Tax=Streptomyces sp. NPDC006368 TaxID=3156760 RepID=UPI0033AF8D28